MRPKTNNEDDPYDLESYWKVVRPQPKGGRKKASNLVGKKFHRLVVLRRHGTDKHGSSTWLCQCTCVDATLKVVSRRALRQGRVKSCGCLLKEHQQNPHKPHLRGQERFGERDVRWDGSDPDFDDDDDGPV